MDRERPIGDRTARAGLIVCSAVAFLTEQGTRVYAMRIQPRGWIDIYGVGVELRVAVCSLRVGVYVPFNWRRRRST